MTRHYFYVDNDKLIVGYIGLIYNSVNNVTFSSYSNYGVLPLGLVVKVIKKQLQTKDYLNQEIFIENSKWRKGIEQL